MDPGSLVRAIADHHEDEEAHLDAVGGCNRVIMYDSKAGKGIGSTCSIVAAHLRNLDQNSVDVSGAALALAGVVALDTACFDPSRGKTTAFDEASRDWLLEQVPGARLLAAAGVPPGDAPAGLVEAGGVGSVGPGLAAKRAALARLYDRL